MYYFYIDYREIGSHVWTRAYWTGSDWNRYVDRAAQLTAQECNDLQRRFPDGKYYGANPAPLDDIENGCLRLG